MTKPHALSTTGRAVLSAAVARKGSLVLPPEHLPLAARNAVLRALLKSALVEKIAAGDDQSAWRTTEGEERLALRVTDAGLRAIGIESADCTPRAAQSLPEGAATANAAPHAPEAAEGAGAAPAAILLPDKRSNVRAAPQRVVAAWDEAGRPALPDAVAILRSTSAKAPGNRKRAAPRANTKQASVLALLRRPEGVSGPAIAEVTGWAAHTVRAFLTGLAKKGIAVTVLDRVRQAEPGNQGAKGSYTIYRIVEVD